MEGVLDGQKTKAEHVQKPKSDHQIRAEFIQKMQNSTEDAIAQALSDVVHGEAVTEEPSGGYEIMEDKNAELEAVEEAALYARHAFHLFDHGKKGYLTADELALAVRWLGVHPSQMACDVIAKSLQCDAKRCSEHVFVGAMVPAPPCARLDKVEVADAWRQFDPLHRGELPEAEVLTILTEFGEPLTLKE